MKTSHLTVVFPLSLGLVGILLIVLWNALAPSTQFANRLPGLDGTPDKSTDSDQRPLVAMGAVAGPATASPSDGLWAGFRGNQRDAISDDPTPLGRSWQENGPELVWQIGAADGYAGAAISAGRVYVLDYNESDQMDSLRCLSLEDGQEIWRNEYPVNISPNHGVTRTVPAIAGDAVVTIGPRCHIACWDANTGENRWLFDMIDRYDSEERQWYTGQCPLIDQQRVILAPCGPDSLMVAIDLNSGEEIWRTPNPRGWKMSHSSIMPIEFAGRRMYVYCGSGGTVGVSAEDGELLWDDGSWVEQFATSPSPLLLPDGRLFLSSGYATTGAMFLQLSEQDGKVTATPAATLDRKQFNSEQQTPILYDGHLFGVRKYRGGQFLCLDLEGNEVWNSGEDKFGHGPYMIADGMLLILEDHGLLVAAEATAEAYRPLWRKQLFGGGHEAWAPMAIADGRLIVRDMSRIACVDLRKQ